MKRIISLSLFLVFALSTAGVLPVLAETSAAVTDVGNKLCPVGGEPVSGSDFVVVQGKRYGLCCPMCAKKLQANPEKYIAKMLAQEPNLAGTVEAVTAQPAAAAQTIIPVVEPMDMGHEQAEKK